MSGPPPRRALRPLALCLFGLAWAVAASASDAQGAGAAEARAADDDGIAFSASLYLWVPAIEGSVAVRSLPLDVDTSLTEIGKASDSLIGVPAHLGVRWGRFGAFIDPVYLYTRSDFGGSLLGGHVRSDTLLLDFGLQYDAWHAQLFGDPASDHHAGRLEIDAVLGGRLSYLDLEIAPLRGVRLGSDRAWADPIVGGLARLALSDSFGLRVGGDIGGFGAASKLTWSASGLLGWGFDVGRARLWLYAGYRALGDDYSEGSGASRFRWDVVMHGPVLGLSAQL